MNTPTLIILGGFAGSGKTTIAKKLAGERSYPFFSTDDYNAKLMSLYGTSFHETAPNAHELTWHIVKKNLEAGVTCILDTNMCSDRSWKNLDTLRNTHPQVHVIPILLTCSLETHRSRIEKRGKEDLSHLNLGGDKLEEVLFKYELYF